MVMAFVLALTAVSLGQFDPLTFNLIDSPDATANGADYFHMLFDFGHSNLLYRVGKRVKDKPPLGENGGPSNLSEQRGPPGHSFNAPSRLMVPVLVGRMNYLKFHVLAKSHVVAEIRTSAPLRPHRPFRPTAFR